MTADEVLLPGIGRIAGTFAELKVPMGEGTPDMAVYRNPGEEQLRLMLDQATLNTVRWLRAPNDEVYVWPAWRASHAFMRQSLGFGEILDSGIIVLDPKRGLVATK